MLFGGNGTGTDCDQQGNQEDTWLWNGTSWTKCDICLTNTHPNRRQGEGLAHDSLHGNVVLFGGTGTCPTDDTKCSDTWTWNGSNLTWTRCDDSPTGPCATHPSPRGSAAMEFHAGRGVVVLFGGKEQINIVDDTWFWDGSAWSDQTSNFTDPSPRTAVRMSYDAAHA